MSHGSSGPVSVAGRAMLRALPHHDGSELYTAPGPHRLGDTVPVRVRVPRSSDVTEVWLRTVQDAEPRMRRATVVDEDGRDVWYEADVLVHHPVTHYRFALVRPGGVAWLDATGVHDRGVTDAHDFRISTHAPGPTWLRDAVVYQIFPDRFARSAAAATREQPGWAIPAAWDEEPIARGVETGWQFYGGDLDGIVERLEHVADLGVTTVYLTPVFPGQTCHRYDASTFDRVDPLLGGDDAYARLAEAVHTRGLRLMGDLTTNHTGATHEWFERAQAEPTSPEHDFYLWTEPDAPDGAAGYVGWVGHARLPKLDFRSPELRSRMIEGPDSVVGRWLQEPYALDGWRIDVANMTGRYGTLDLNHDVARTVRATIEQINPDGALISEHFHDARDDLAGDTWHANMNYTAFSNPLWTWLSAEGSDVSYHGMHGVPVPRRQGAEVVAEMRDFDGGLPWDVLVRQWNMLGSHDTPRIRTLVGSRELHEVAAGILFTYLGVPVVFAGDEFGLTGTTGEHARATMPWDEPARRDEHTHDVYRRLAALRHAHRALREGSLRWVLVDDDALGYVRETRDETILVVAARAPWTGAVLPLGGSAERLFGSLELGAVRDAGAAAGHGAGVGAGAGAASDDASPSADGLVVPGAGPHVGVWRLT